MISAILIPLVFWYLGNRELQKQIPNVMDLAIPKRYDPEIPLEKQIFTFEPIRNWNYKKIIVPTNLAKKNSNFYVSEIKILQKRNIKKTGIEFVLNKNSSYGDFASILNDFHIAKHEYYAVDLDKTGNIFATVGYLDPNFKILKEPSYFSNDTIEGFYQPSFIETFRNNLLKLPKQAFCIIFGFLIFLNISMFSIKDSFQIR